MNAPSTQDRPATTTRSRAVGRRAVSAALSVLLAIVSSCSGPGIQSALAEGYPPESQWRILTRVSQSTTAQQLASIVSPPLDSGRTPSRVTHLDSLDARLYLLEYPSVAAASNATLHLDTQGLVDFWEYDPRIQVAGAAPLADSLFGSQWTFKTGPEFAGSLGDVSSVWDRIERSGQVEGAPIAVLDTGLATGHDEFRGAVRIQADFVGEGDEEVADLHPHGTAVASLIAARRQPGDDGIVGVAPTAVLHVYRVMDEGQGWLGDALAALNVAVADRVRVSCNAWYTETESKAFQVALEGAGLAGHLFVAAAANFGQSVQRGEGPYPAAYAPTEGLLVVGALDRTAAPASFTNFGKVSIGDASVHFAAPGVEVLSALPPAGWTTGSGTSYAAAHAAGAVALGLSARLAEKREIDAASLPLKAIRQALQASMRTDATLGEMFEWGGALDAVLLSDALLTLP